MFVEILFFFFFEGGRGVVCTNTRTRKAKKTLQTQKKKKKGRVVFRGHSTHRKTFARINSNLHIGTELKTKHRYTHIYVTNENNKHTNIVYSFLPSSLLQGSTCSLASPALVQGTKKGGVNDY